MCRVQNVEADDAITAAADDFYAFLQTDEVMEIFEKYMFLNNAD
jgi:accessory colonization factor AcfC